MFPLQYCGLFHQIPSTQQCLQLLEVKNSPITIISGASVITISPDRVSTSVLDSGKASILLCTWQMYFKMKWNFNENCRAEEPNMQYVVRIKNTLKTSQFYIIEAQCWQNVSCYNTTGKRSKTTMMNTRICWYTALSINHLYLPRSEWRNHTIAIICSLPDRDPPSIKTATQWLWLISLR